MDIVIPPARLIQPGEPICPAQALAERGRGMRFEITCAGVVVPAFAIRYRGLVYAYINRCAHQAVSLDWNEGIFFSADQEFLLCSTHGARYHPATGACAGGRCYGQGLVPVSVKLDHGHVVLFDHP